MTGTPMSRSMAEIYTMQRYLQNDTLREYGVDKFDNWFATFGGRKRTETGTNGKIKDVTSATFINVPELSALYSRVADSVTANDLGLPRPTVKGGAPQMVMAQMDEISHQMFDDLIKRVESLRGPVVKGADNHLSLYTKMRQVAADLRLSSRMHHSTRMAKSPRRSKTSCAFTMRERNRRWHRSWARHGRAWHQAQAEEGW